MEDFTTHIYYEQNRIVFYQSQRCYITLKRNSYVKKMYSFPHATAAKKSTIFQTNQKFRIGVGSVGKKDGLIAAWKLKIDLWS